MTPQPRRVMLNIDHNDLSHYVSGCIASLPRKKMCDVISKRNRFVFVCLFGVVVAVIAWQLHLQLPVQSVPITTKVASSNSVHGKVYSILGAIKVVSDLRQVGGFLRVLRFPPSIKTDRHDITEILLKVALNTKNQTNLCLFIRYSRFTCCVRQYVQTLVLIFVVSTEIFLQSFQRICHIIEDFSPHYCRTCR